MTEKEKLRSTNISVKGLGVVLGLGTLILAAYNGSALEPRKVYEIEVNGDNNPDIVVQRDFISNRKYVFIAQEDGSYKPLSGVLSERSQEIQGSVGTLRQSLESELEQFRNSIEAKVQGLE